MVAWAHPGESVGGERLGSNRTLPPTDQPCPVLPFPFPFQPCILPCLTLPCLTLPFLALLCFLSLAQPSISESNSPHTCLVCLCPGSCLCRAIPSPSQPCRTLTFLTLPCLLCCAVLSLPWPPTSPGGRMTTTSGLP